MATTQQPANQLTASPISQPDLAPLSPTAPTTTVAQTPALASDKRVTSVIAPAPSEAASRLTEAIDEFIQDVERKFRGVSDEILGRLDEMTERCDRLEQEMLAREGGLGGNGKSGGKSVESLGASSV